MRSTRSLIESDGCMNPSRKLRTMSKNMARPFARRPNLLTAFSVPHSPVCAPLENVAGQHGERPHGQLHGAAAPCLAALPAASLTVGCTDGGDSAPGAIVAP